jgi:hypothetical protein
VQRWCTRAGQTALLYWAGLGAEISFCHTIDHYRTILYYTVLFQDLAHRQRLTRFQILTAMLGSWQPSPAASTTDTSVAQSQWQPERNPVDQDFRQASLLSIVSYSTEYSEPLTPERPVTIPTSSEGLTAIASRELNYESSPVSDTTSQRPSTSDRSGSSGPIGDLSTQLSKERDLVISSDGQGIAFWNRTRAKIFSKRSDWPALLSREAVHNIESRQNSTWEQIQFAGPIIALRDKKTRNVCEFAFLHSPLC